MEAIEFAVAEPGAARIDTDIIPARLVLGERSPYTLLDLCPLAGATFTPDEPIACVPAVDLLCGAYIPIPAELVILPYIDREGTGKFGSSSNGLASGNTVEEATLHAALEVLERDAKSFSIVRNDARVIEVASLPDDAKELIASAEGAGLDVCVRSLRCEVGLPVFETILWDRSCRSSFFLNGGWGCHLARDIALRRSITEAIQGRLSWIHGSRDDFEQQVREIGEVDPLRSTRQAALAFAACANSATRVDYALTPDFSGAADGSVLEALTTLLSLLEQNRIRQITRVVYTAGEDDLQVVRVVIPTCEYFDLSSRRIGPRLAASIAGDRNA